MRFLAADAARVLHIASCQEAEVIRLRRFLETVAMAVEGGDEDASSSEVARALRELTLRQLAIAVCEAIAVPKKGDINLRQAFELLRDPDVRAVVGKYAGTRQIDEAMASWNEIVSNPGRSVVKQMRDWLATHRGPVELPADWIVYLLKITGRLADVGERLNEACYRDRRGRRERLEPRLPQSHRNGCQPHPSVNAGDKIPQ